MFELRLLIMHGSFLLAALVAMLYSFISGDLARVLFCSIVIFVLFPIVFFKNKIRFYDDFCVLFSYKLIGILPIVVDYKDITNIEVISNYKVKVKHKYDCNVYVLNSGKFKNILEEKIAGFS